MIQLNKVSVGNKERVIDTKQAKGYSKNKNFTRKKKRETRRDKNTGEVAEFDVGLGTVCIEFWFGWVKNNSLSEKFSRQFKVVFHKGLFCFLFKIGSHRRQKKKKSIEREQETKRYKKKRLIDPRERERERERDMQGRE